MTLLQNTDALGKTSVILTDDMPLALAITKRRASKFSSHSVLSCCMRIQPFLQCCHTGALRPNPADATSRQKWIDARPTRAPRRRRAHIRSSESRQLRRASAQQSRHARPAALFWRAKPYKLLSNAMSIATFTTGEPSTTPHNN